MFSFLQYAFMQRALITGLALGLCLPCIGLTVVLRRQSMIGDALSHNALAGVACGLLLGVHPLVGAITLSVVSAFGIELIRKKMGRYAELALAIVLSAGIGLASILSDFVQAGSSFSSFLFGSIVAVSPGELYLVLIVSAMILAIYRFLYQALFLLAYSPQQARLTGIRVGLVEFIFTLMTSLTVAIASRTVGALIVSSYMVLPVACAMQIFSGFRSTLIGAIAFSEIFTLLGLIISFHFNLKPGGTFVLFGLICLLVVIALPALWRRLSPQRTA